MTIFLFSAAAQAEPSAKDQLEETQETIAKEEAKAAEIASQRQQLNAELGKLRGNLVKLVADIQSNEKSLAESEEKLRILNKEAEEKARALEVHKAQLKAMISASIRLSQTPPDAAIMMPGDLRDTMKSARVLEGLTGSIKRESESVAAQVEELKALQERVRRSREKMVEEKSALQVQRKELDTKLAERKSLAITLLTQRDQTKRKLAELSRKARDLKELMGSLEQQRVSEQKDSPKKVGMSGKLRSFADAKGDMRAPVSGKLKRGFGENLSANETSKGATLDARAGAQVVAPYDGEVVFTGPFLNYGKMVILRHSDGFHSLLAGFASIDVNVGEFLLEGEPIGAMNSDPDKADLYVELRKDNQPVDPGNWIPALKKKG